MSEPFLAQIVMFAGNFAPRSWSFCSGQLLAINSNQAVFSLLGTTYGGDGRTTFGLPDFRGRVPVGSEGNSAGPGLTTRVLGAKGGAENTTLNINNLPAHSHTGTIKAKNGQPDESNPGGAFPASLTNGTEGYAESTNVNMAPGVVQTDNTGRGQAHNNMQPFLAINFIIALQGIFPSRN